MQGLFKYSGEAETSPLLVSMTKTSEPGSAKEVNIKKFLPGDELVMACLAQKHIFELDGYTTAEKYMLTQCMVWYIQRDHIGDGGFLQKRDHMEELPFPAL